MNYIIKKTLSSVLIGSVLIFSTPFIANAQATTQTTQTTQTTRTQTAGAPNNPNATVAGQDSTNGKTIYNANAVNQATTYQNGIQSGQGVVNSGNAATGIGSAIGCSAGQILANMITSSIASAVGSATGAATDQALKVNNVPVIQDSQSRPVLLQEIQNVAHTGQTGVGGILSGASWDSIGWCVVNAIISYIADATIQWANSGFNGNPAFVDNPSQFFTDLADNQAASFISGLVKNTTGLNVCQPFRVQLALNLGSSYSNGNQQAACTINSIVTNYKSFVNGNFQQGGWRGWISLTQNDANNIYGSYIINNQLMQSKIATQNNTAQVELGWNKGFLSFTHCDDETKHTGCHTTTPGTLVQSSLEKTMGIPKDRLVLAQKFDQVVSTVVNDLIVVALDKALSSNNKNK